MILVGIDPGPAVSAVATLFPDGTGRAQIADNRAALTLLRGLRAHSSVVLVIEGIESYGKVLGRTTLDTCIWIGRFAQRWNDDTGSEARVMYRSTIKLTLVGRRDATDAAIRAAILDRYGGSRAKAIGYKHAPGPLYGVAGHGWSALAVCLAYADLEKRGTHAQAVLPSVSERPNGSAGTGDARPTERSG